MYIFKTPRPNLYDLLKCIAIITMIVDHIGFFFFPDMMERRMIGRFAFPLFLLLVGFSGSYYFKSHILYAGCILQIPFWIYTYYTGAGTYTLNILFGILVTQYILSLIVKHTTHKSIDRQIVGGVSIAVLLLHFLLPTLWEYGGFAILFGIAGHIRRRYTSSDITRRGFMPIVYTIALRSIYFVHMQSIFFFSYSMLSVIIIGSIGISYALYTLSHNNISFTHTTLLPYTMKKTMQYMSHYALYIYVIHIVLLSIGATLL